MTEPLERENITIGYICPTDGKPKQFRLTGAEFFTEVQDCDDCGWHGMTEMSITCDCKDRYHDIVVASR